MAAKLKHLAITSGNHTALGQFYEKLFGLKRFSDSSAAVTDGYVGVNINPRAVGRQAGFDHFGFEVDDVEEIFALAAERYPNVHYIKRPSNRPFASISMHDPAGNVFDLTQRGMENRRDVYANGAEADQRTPRHVNHIQLRAVDPATLVDFYRNVFGLVEREPCHLTDGVVTFVIASWRIADYLGSGIERPALDHLGFEVESLEAFEADLHKLTESDPSLAPRPVGGQPEAEVRLKLFQTCRYGQYQVADPDGVLIDVSSR